MLRDTIKGLLIPVFCLFLMIGIPASLIKYFGVRETVKGIVIMSVVTVVVFVVIFYLGWPIR